MKSITSAVIDLDPKCSYELCRQEQKDREKMEQWELFVELMNYLHDLKPPFSISPFILTLSQLFAGNNKR